MPKITHEETFAARDVMPPVEVTYTTRPTGQELYLLRFGEVAYDHELTHAEAEALRDALDLAINSAEAGHG